MKFLSNKYLFAIVLLSLLIIIGLYLFQQFSIRQQTVAFKEFLAEHEAKVASLTQETQLAFFESSISGKDEDYQKASELEVQLTKIYTSKQDYQKLKAWKESEYIKDPLLVRQLDILNNTYLENQVDEQKMEEIIKLQNKLNQTFATYRADINGKKLTDNDLKNILKTSTDSTELKTAWMASKQVGSVVAPDVIRLVKMRNEVAQELGFENYHVMQLTLNEQNPADIERLFSEIDQLTRDAFIQQKDEIDEFLSSRYGIAKDQLMPWHYQDPFFQEAPEIYNVDLDGYYSDQDIVEIIRDYYAGLGIPIDDLIARSDLYEKEGKYQHACCGDIDREGDIRVIANVKPNAYWMDTLLHEFGHGAYAKYTDPELPWLLRQEAHIFTTEAVAMMFGKLASNPVWMHDVIGISAEESAKLEDLCAKSSQLETIVLSRWFQVMYHFEKSMYENPEQDLNKLWWDVVEDYQMLNRPPGRNEADWAAKIHIATAPAYYHNYLLGDVLASQLYYHIVDKVLQSPGSVNQSFSGNKQVGQYLVENVFKPGKRYSWNEMIERATGEKLTAKYYARQFEESK